MEKRETKAWMMSWNSGGTSILHEELQIPLLLPGGTTEWERRKLPEAPGGFRFNHPDPHSHLPQSGKAGMGCP